MSLARKIKKQLPLPLKRRLVFWKYLGGVLRDAHGAFPRECNACGHKGDFHAFGFPPRYDALCPACNSMERHRFLLLSIARRDLDLKEPILHFAPEAIIERQWRKQFSDYKTADLTFESDVRLNLEKIELPDNSQQTIVCSHVLEHVDDAKALPEMFRILKPGGQAILMVPVIEGWVDTYENPTVHTEEDRLLHFNQKDHVRYYGREFRDRVKSAGFELSELGTTPEDCRKYGLMRGEVIFIGTKPINPVSPK